MSNQANDVVILQVLERLPVLFLCHLFESDLALRTIDAAISPFLLQEVQQVSVLQPLCVDSVSELSLDVLDEGDDDLQLLCACLRLASCDDVHVDLSSSWIGGRLLQRILDKLNGFINILLFNVLSQSHLGKGFRDPDHRLKLSGCSCDRFGVVAKASHLHILLHQVDLDGLGDLWLAAFSCIRDVLCEEVSVNFV